MMKNPAKADRQRHTAFCKAESASIPDEMLKLNLQGIDTHVPVEGSR